MKLLRRLLVYAVCGVVVAAFSPVLPFHYLAAAGVILVGLALVDLVQHSRRRF
ncbi:MAG TPA: hypothetical protein VL974_13345 [Magnetospirillum sp.]|jgi:hypothetical protein|nr:hypothetical protein [Magnetospirillum sp.]